MIRSMLIINKFLISLLIGWRVCCQPIRCQVWKSVSTNMDFIKAVEIKSHQPVVHSSVALFWPVYCSQVQYDPVNPPSRSPLRVTGGLKTFSDSEVALQRYGLFSLMVWESNLNLEEPAVDIVQTIEHFKMAKIAYDMGCNFPDHTILCSFNWNSMTSENTLTVYEMLPERRHLTQGVHFAARRCLYILIQI